MDGVSPDEACFCGEGLQPVSPPITHSLPFHERPAAVNSVTWYLPRAVM